MGDLLVALGWSPTPRRSGTITRTFSFSARADIPGSQSQSVCLAPWATAIPTVGVGRADHRRAQPGLVIGPQDDPFRAGRDGVALVGERAVRSDGAAGQEGERDHESETEHEPGS